MKTKITIKLVVLTGLYKHIFQLKISKMFLPSALTYEELSHLQHAHSILKFGVHVPLASQIWGYKPIFWGTHLVQ